MPDTGTCRELPGPPTGVAPGPPQTPLFKQFSYHPLRIRFWAVASKGLMTYDSAQGNFLHLSLRVSVRPCGAAGGQIRAKVGRQEVRVGPYRIRMRPWQVRLGPGDHSRVPGDQSGS